MIRTLALAIAIMAAPLGAVAQGLSFGSSDQDTSAPVEVVADELSVNQTDGTALYTGDVVISQDDMRLSAPRVLVIYSEEAGRIDRMEATGGVTLVSGDEAAEAARADYDFDTETILLTGDVLVTQGDSALSAQRMTVHLSDGTAELSGRVRTVLQQGDEKN